MEGKGGTKNVYGNVVEVAHQRDIKAEVAFPGDPSNVNHLVAVLLYFFIVTSVSLQTIP